MPLAETEVSASADVEVAAVVVADVEAVLVAVLVASVEVVVAASAEAALEAVASEVAASEDADNKKEYKIQGQPHVMWSCPYFLCWELEGDTKKC